MLIVENTKVINVLFFIFYLLKSTVVVFIKVAARKPDRLVLQDECGSNHFTLYIANIWPQFLQI